MVCKTKRISIKNEFMGRNYVKEIRKTYGDIIANKIKLIKEISFNVPVYYSGTDEIAYRIPKRLSGIWNYQKKLLSLIEKRPQLFLVGALLFFKKEQKNED